MTQQSLLDPVAHARHTDPETSHKAAASVKDVSETQVFILACLMKRGPVTDEQLIAYIRDVYPHRKITDQSVRSRRAELRDKGLVVDSGHRRPTSNGGKSTVWKVAQ